MEKNSQKHWTIWMGGLLLFCCCVGESESVSKDYSIRPVPFTSVHIEDAFWGPRLETNRQVTLPTCFQKCEETGRLANFAKAAGRMKGPFQGIRFDDSDVFKVVEGAAYTLSLEKDPELEAYVDRLIQDFEGAQEPDGYLYTNRTIDPEHPAPDAGKHRWEYLRHSHELYNIGHMYEAAVAYLQATSKDEFLKVALKSANLVDHEFGPGKHQDPPGHQEIEIGLAKLYRVTGDPRYLELAKFFLDARGHGEGRELYGEEMQDATPVLQQREAVGHAVRAAYMYSAMADVAALTGDEDYHSVLDTIWQDVVSRKIYLTGGIGARRKGEAFGAPYELPNKEAYNETCAAIANMFWNHRMFLLEGDSKYMDVFERTLYNGFLSGVGMSGDRFFYPNPLAADGLTPFNQGKRERSPWFDCSCCPVNIVRFLPSLSGYVYAKKSDSLYVNLYIAGKASIDFASGPVRVTQQTDYPWSGKVTLTLSPEKETEFSLRLRLPIWARGRPLPSDLYSYVNDETSEILIRINGQEVPYSQDKGYAVLSRQWKKGDTVEIEFPMPVRRVHARKEVQADRGRVAFERGPIVYCAEGVDHGGHVENLIIGPECVLTPQHRPDLLGGVVVLSGMVQAKSPAEGGEPAVQDGVPFQAIPYYSWNHRGPCEMAVWLPENEEVAVTPRSPTIASKSRVKASHGWESDGLCALNDGIEPSSSSDQEVPRFTWWDHVGTSEWVQYEFDKNRQVSAVEVYWFVDPPKGKCRIPEAWTLLYRDGGKWKPVLANDLYGTETDRFNRVAFDPVVTDALRIQVDLQPQLCAGLLEWKVDPDLSGESE